MKKTLLLGGLLAAALYANAQQRLVIYESFSGENCGPCASTNPPFWDFINSAINQNKVILVKYQVNIPQAAIHPLYDQNIAEAEARRGYYSVTSAPNGKIDGRTNHPTATNPGHPGYFLEAGGQDTLNAEAAIPSPFNITVTPTVTGTTLNANITVTAVAGYTGTTVKLRAALVEGLHYATPPGNNGEVDFHNVMRKMYPSADGQPIAGTWTNGQTQTFTISGAIPQYVDRTAQKLFLVVWIQDDANKKIAQAGKSANLPLPPLDAGITGATPANGSLFCAAGTQAHKVTLKNTGTTAMTSAEIYYKVGSAAYQMYSWSGNLAAGASTEATVGNITLAPGIVTVKDSVGKVNAQAEINPANSVYSSSYTAYTAPAALPQTSSFEGGMPAGWAVLDNNNKVVANPAFRGETWATFTAPDITAFDGAWTAVVSNADMTAGNKTTLILPLATIPAGPKALDFYYANAMRTTIGDKMEVVYSTDCGANWTALWTKSNADLANNPPTAASSLLVPDATSDYRFISIDMSAITADALVGFRSTSGGGNYIWLDKVNFRTGVPNGIEELVSGGNASLYPNPASDQVTVELNMVKSAKVSFQIINMLGQQVGKELVKDLKAGQTNTNIATNDLAPGIYFMNIATEKGNLQQKFVKK